MNSCEKIVENRLLQNIFQKSKANSENDHQQTNISDQSMKTAERIKQ